jgi:hypothetical protein
MSVFQEVEMQSPAAIPINRIILIFPRIGMYFVYYMN